MRILAVICGCLALTLSACGASSSPQSNLVLGSEVDKPIKDSPKPPHFTMPPGPPPKVLGVHDVRVGSGPAIPAKGEVKIASNFVAFSYRTHEPFEVNWSPSGAFNIGFGPDREIEGWEKGLVGMKAGGRRELKVPARMAYGEAPIFYVVDLLAVERSPFK